MQRFVSMTIESIGVYTFYRKRMLHTHILTEFAFENYSEKLNLEKTFVSNKLL